MKLTISFLLFVLSAFQVHAADSLNTKLTNSYTSLRAMGMGNAFTAVADDYSLLFYNPAGLARKPYNEVQVSLVGAGVSAKTLTIMDDIKKASDTQGTDSQKAQAVSDALEKYYGESLGGKVQALEMFWVRKGWGVALIPVDLTIDMSVNRQLGPALDLNVKGDSSFSFGYGTNLTREVDLGVTGKFLHRVAVAQSVSALELASNSDVLSKDRFIEGNNLDFDIGVMWTPGWFAKSTAAEKVTTPSDSMAPAAPVKNESLKPDNSETEKEKIEDEKKPDGAPPGPEIKPEVKPDEPRAPQAEDAATVVQVSDDKKTDDTAKDAAAKPADPTVTTDAPKADAPAADAKAEEKKEEVKKDDAAPAEPVITKPVDSGVVKLGDTKTESVTADYDSGPAYPLTLGMTVHNVIAGGFSQSKLVNKDATDVPAKIDRTIDVGSQYRLYDGEDLKIRTMLDFHDLLAPNVTLRTSTHAGFEFDYSPSGYFKTQFRVGLNQMYMTAGATLLLGVLNIDFVTYGEEVGTDSNKIENRVMAAKLGFNF
jgi:hypothetical protein